MKIVCISKDQPEFVEKMVDAFGDIEYVIVRDRCTVEYPDGFKYIDNEFGEGFMAGYARDLGAREFDDDILFLDGDKVPDVSEKKLEYISTLPFDCVLLGLGRGDLRIFMTCGEGSIPNYSNASYNNEIYSCGIFLRKEIIKKIKDINGGRIFHEAFDGRWGEEDRFLGDELRHIGAKIGYTSKITLDGTITNLSVTASPKRYAEFHVNQKKRFDLVRNLLR